MQDISNIKNNPLFMGLTEEEIIEAIKTEMFAVRRYIKGSYIASEGEECDHIGVVINGLIEVQAEYASGKTITIHRLHPGETYGEAVIFSSTAAFPATLYCPENTETLVITRTQLISAMGGNKRIVENFLKLLSDRLISINRRIKILSLETLRQRIAAYLMEEQKLQQNSVLNLGINREQMARLLNVQRPSLSRELGLLQDEGIISFNRDAFVITNQKALAEIVTDTFG